VPFSKTDVMVFIPILYPAGKGILMGRSNGEEYDFLKIRLFKRTQKTMAKSMNGAPIRSSDH